LAGFAISNNPFVAVKPFSNGELLIRADGQAFILWKLTLKQQEFYGKRISPFFCFAKADLCERHLKRPHLTCFTCKVLAMVSGKLPILTPIIIRQVWDIQPKGKLHKFVFKNCLSCAEFTS